MIESLGSIRECLRMLVDLVAVGPKDNEGCIGVKALFRINVDAVVEDTFWLRLSLRLSAPTLVAPSNNQLQRAVVRVVVHHPTAASASEGGGEGFVRIIFMEQDSSLIFPSVLHHWLNVLLDYHSTTLRTFYLQVICHNPLDAWVGATRGQPPASFTQCSPRSNATTRTCSSTTLLLLMRLTVNLL